MRCHSHSHRRHRSHTHLESLVPYVRCVILCHLRVASLRENTRERERGTSETRIVNAAFALQECGCCFDRRLDRRRRLDLFQAIDHLPLRPGLGEKLSRTFLAMAETAAKYEDDLIASAAKQPQRLRVKSADKQIQTLRPQMLSENFLITIYSP